MTARPKLAADRTEHGTEARCVPQALEPLQASLTLPDGLVLVLDAVVLTPAAEVRDGWHHADFRRRVTPQPIDHDGARHHRRPFKGLRKKRFAASGLRRR
jgi:hypothetical protein